MLTEAIQGLKWKSPQDFEPDDFRAWAKHHMSEHFPRNPAHQLMARERRIRTEHSQVLDEARARTTDALALCSSLHQQLEQLHTQRRQLEKKMVGLRDFLAAKGQRERKPNSTKGPTNEAEIEGILMAREEELARSGVEREVLKAEIARLQALPDYQTYLTAVREEEALEQRLGLHDIGAELRKANATTGAQSKDSGSRFERIGARLWEGHCNSLFGPPPPDFERHILRNLTLSLAANEIDLMCVLVDTRDRSQPVLVEAIAECKSNPDDIARSFVRFTPLLAFFRGELDKYNTEDFRNSRYPKGIFRKCVHKELSVAYNFSPESFKLFEFDEASNYFVERVHLLTHRRKAISRLPFKIEQIFASRLYRTLHIDENDIDAIPDDVFLSWKTENFPDILPILQLFRRFPHQYLIIGSLADTSPASQ